MEGSVASNGGGGDAAQQGNAGEGQGEAQGPDLSSLAEQLGTLSAGQEEMRQFLQSQPWQAEEQQQEPQQQDEELDLSWLDPADPEYSPDQIAQRLGGLIDQTVQQRTEAGLQPLREQVNEMRETSEWQSIAGEFPELVEDQEVARGAFGLAAELAKANGHPELATQPWFVRLAYITGKAVEAANEEGAETPSAAHLEGGGGAAPAGSQVNLGDVIVSGGEGAPLGRRALPF